MHTTIDGEIFTFFQNYKCQKVQKIKSYLFLIGTGVRTESSCGRQCSGSSKQTAGIRPGQ